MEFEQQTLAEAVSFEGVGIHTGEVVTMSIRPADADSGIVFVRTDLPGKPEIPASYENVHQDKRGLRRTVLSKEGEQVQTVEHLMAALWGVGIDNARIEVSAIEVPAMDGSALPYVEAINKVGVVRQAAPRKYIDVKEPLMVQEGDSSVAIFPSSETKFNYLLSYPHPLLNSQQAVCHSTDADVFMREVAPARTFCLKEEAEALRAAGFGKGADLNNTLVFDVDGVLENKLRFENECARHKLLDLIGDLFLMGTRFRGQVFAVKSGHVLNAKLLTKLNQAHKKWNAGALKSGVSKAIVGSQLDINQIQEILPHRYPFLLVDRVIEFNENSAVGIKNVTMNEGFFQGHFPGHPVMPGVLMIEALAQLGGIIMLNKPEHRGKIAYFMAVDKVKFRKPVTPGDQLEMHVELGKVRSKTGQVFGKVLVEGKIVCQGELMFAIAEA